MMKYMKIHMASEIITDGNIHRTRTHPIMHTHAQDLQEGKGRKYNQNPMKPKDNSHNRVDILIEMFTILEIWQDNHNSRHPNTSNIHLNISHARHHIHPHRHIHHDHHGPDLTMDPWVLKDIHRTTGILMIDNLKGNRQMPGNRSLYHVNAVRS
jgi:hypothetical protein